MRLTETGGRLLPVARDLERDFARLEALNRQPEAASPSLRAAVIHSLGGGVLADFLARL